MSHKLEEILNSDDTKKHEAWIVRANIQELDEYLSHSNISATGTLYRLASARRQQLQFEVSRKPHSLLWMTFIFTVIAAVASVIGYWPQIEAAVRALLLFLSSHGKR